MLFYIYHKIFITNFRKHSKNLTPLVFLLNSFNPNLFEISFLDWFSNQDYPGLIKIQNKLKIAYFNIHKQHLKPF